MITGRGALPRLPLEGPRDILSQMKGLWGVKSGVQDKKDDRHDNDPGNRADAKACEDGQAIKGGGPATRYGADGAAGEHGAKELAKGTREAFEEGLEDVEDHVSDRQSGCFRHRFLRPLTSGGVRYGRFQGVDATSLTYGRVLA